MKLRKQFYYLLGLPFVFVLSLCFLLSNAYSYSSGPLPSKTGAPGDGGVCTDCHSSFALNSGTGSLTISGAPTTYALSTDYTITVTLQESGISKFGFEACVKKTADNTQAGTITVGNSTEQQTKSSGGITYIEHTSSGNTGSGGSKSWSFTWTSPSSDIGSVKFYAAGNAANGNGGSDGDHIYTTSSSSPIDAVPVELSAFDARIGTGNTITLNWSTASETNNLGYEIQRSIDGKTFTTVGFVSGNGTSTKENKYSFAIPESEAGTYYYRLKQLDFDGSFEFSEVRTITVGAPSSFALNQNYPNPFNPSTIIEYQISESAPVSLTIYDLNGRTIRTLVNEFKPAGIYSISWDGTNNLNIPVSSGLYIYRISAGSFKTTKKMLLVR